jgi:ABC-2 type transport system permease protein
MEAGGEMIKELIKAYFIAKKDMGAYYLKPPLISWGLMLPIVFVFAFYFRNPAGIKEVVPGLIGLTLLFSCTSMAAIVITFEKRIGALERLLLAPVKLRTILLGKTLGSTLFGVMITFCITIFLIPVMGLSVIKPFSFVIIIIFSGLSFSLLGILISVGVKEVFEAMTMSNFFRFPMIFLCGVFFPVSSMPFPLPVVSYLLPLTYTVDGLKHCLLENNGSVPLSLSLLILLGFVILIYTLSLFIFRRRIRQEF